MDIANVECRDAGAWGQREGSSPAVKELGQGEQSTLALLSADIILSYFLLTFVLLSGLTSFYPQEFITCHKMQ